MSAIVALAIAAAVALAGSGSEGLGQALAAAQPESFARFAGGWARHGFGLSIQPDGQARATWRTYRWCGPGVPQPCDSMQDNLITSGGQATLVFTRVEGASAYGRVLASTDSETFPAGGDIVLTLEPYGMARLWDGVAWTDLCGPRFADEAPREVVESAPCGA